MSGYVTYSYVAGFWGEIFHKLVTIHENFTFKIFTTNVYQNSIVIFQIYERCYS